MSERERDILLAAKAECLRLFAPLLPAAAKESAEKLFAMAYKTTNFAEHHLLIGAYGTLAKREAVLIRKLQASLAELLDRSVATAYNPDRPTLSPVLSADGWSLVDSSMIEDEIKLQKTTSLFHARCGGEIRDLNLRIATLFRQELVKERENPFRPYIFSRCVYTAVGDLGAPPEITMAVIDQLSTQLLDGVADIYKTLNAYFEKIQISAKRPTIVRPDNGQASAVPMQTPHRAESSDNRSSDHRLKEESSVDDQFFASAGNDASRERAQGDISLPVDAAAPMRKIDQLLQMVRKTASANSDAARSVVRPGTGSGHYAGFHSGGSGFRSSGPDVQWSGSEVRPAGNGSISGFTANAGTALRRANSFGSGVSASNAYHSDSRMPDSGMLQGWISGKQIIGDALQRFFADDEGMPANGGSETPYLHDAANGRASHVGGAVYQLLKTAPATRLEDVLDDDGTIRNLIFEERPHLASRANDVNEMMTIDVVGMIFEFILRDPQVPAEVRAQLGRLQFLLLKIALVDPELLTRKTHPARLLINRIGTIAMGLKSNDAFSARVTAEIQRIVEALLADDSNGVALISRLLQEFEDFIDRESRSNNENVERAVEVVQEAGKRSAYLAQLSASLKAVFASVKTEPHLQNFIETVWLRAIEKAEHTDAELALRYRKLVPELVWSILDKRSERERSRLLAHLPQILFDLKAGLNLAKHAEKQAFLSWLIESHTRAIKATGADGESYSLTALRQQFQIFVDTSLAAAPAAGVKVQIDRSVIRDAAEDMKVRLDEIDTGLEADNDSDGEYPDVKAAGAEDEDAGRDDPLSTHNVMQRLRVGVPVEINIDGAPRRAMLNWMSENAVTMVLSLEGNDFPTTISVQLFRRLLANNRARFAEAAPLFERAVASLLETADKVDEICA